MSCAVRARSSLTAGRRLGVGAGRREGRDLQELVDRRRLVLLFGEAVPLGERGDFVRVDPVDQAVEVLAHPRVGAGAVGGFEQDVDGAVELGPRAVRGGRASARARRLRNACWDVSIRVATGSAGGRRGGRGLRRAAATGAGPAAFCGFGLPPQRGTSRLQRPPAPAARSVELIAGRSREGIDTAHEPRLLQCKCPVEVVRL